MRTSEVTEFFKVLYNERCRLENLFVIKWNNIFAHKKFDTLDLLDLIELSVQMDYLNYIEQKIHNLLKLLKDYH